MILARSLAVAAVWKNCSGQGLVGILSLRAHTLAQVEAAVADGTVQDMIDPVEAVLAEYPALYADSYGDRLLANGNPLSGNLVRPQHKEGWVRHVRQ